MILIIDLGPPGGDTATAVALFNFSSQNPDELAISENEELTILLGQCDEEGWLMAMNSRGEKGYIPENYLEIRNMPTQQDRTGDGDSSRASFQHQVPFLLWMSSSHDMEGGAPCSILHLA